ncbi:MAG: hypothetical protein Kow0092_14140 [Deferrisomatales bacterium]
MRPLPLPRPRRGARWLFLPLLACALGIQGTPPPGGRADTRPFREYEVKAAFLYHFTKFVEWPLEALGGPEQPFVLGILGEDPFGAALDPLVGRSVKGHALEIRHYRSAEEAAACHLLYVSRSEWPRAARALDSVSSRPILTVGDADGFAEGGGMIGLLTRGERVRFEINLRAAREAGLQLSSKLLYLAVRVLGAGPGAGP